MASEGRDVTVYRALPSVMRLMLALPLALVGLLAWTAVQPGGAIQAALETIAIPLLVGAALSYVFLRQAHTIVVDKGTGVIEFQTAVGVRVVHVREVVSISPSFLQHGQLVIRHSNGTVAIPAQFSGLHDLVTWVRDQNAAVVVKGL